MNDRAAFEGIQSATILKPGDRVFLVLDGTPYADEMNDIQNLLRERFPDVEFTVASGVRGMVVAQPEPSGISVEETDR